MKAILWVTVLLALCAVPLIASSKPRQPQQGAVTIPPSRTPTVSLDVSFQLGQQTSKIDTVSHRLDVIEGDVKEISKDVGRLNVYASIIGVILLAIVAPLVYKGIERLLFKSSAA